MPNLLKYFCAEHGGWIATLATVVAGVLFSIDAKAQQSDTIKRWGVAVGAGMGKILVVDKYQEKWQKGKNNCSFDVALEHRAAPKDSSLFDFDYGLPVVSARMKVALNHNVTMHRSEDPHWGMAQPVDYYSRMGNTVALYGSFARPFFRNRTFEADAALSAGIGYCNTIYDKENNVDNELIGTHFLVYFGLGTHLTWRFIKDWGIRAGLEYWHLSNGAMGRPNKGANFAGPVISLTYIPHFEQVRGRTWKRLCHPFKRQVYLDFTLGVGAKTLYEEWDKTQFKTPMGEEDYRTGDFKLYMAYSAQTDLMCRYDRKWASGIGFDLFYGGYASTVERIEKERGVEAKHNPWSVGIALKHQAFYKNVSLAMSIGWYLYREMGNNAKDMEKRYYERIGLKYTLPGKMPLTVGASVKAHFTKADLTEIHLSVPLSLNAKNSNEH